MIVDPIYDNARLYRIRKETEDIKMEKKDIDWSNLSFGYQETDYSYVSNYKDGKWDDGQLTKDHTVTLNECAGVFQYAQTCFEGLKAYTTEDGRIVCFRPDLNAQRLKDSCERLEMPVFPEDRFVKAVEEVVKANAAWVPPYGSGATLYIRPYIMGTNAVIGVKPADEYQFRILVTPVGPYFKGGAKPITIRVSDFDRAAPHGTGHIKAGLNYAMSLHAIVDAHAQGFAENMYLDPATRTKVEETGGANFIFITKDGTFVTPKSDSILPSITRRSLMVVAEKYLGLKVEHREVLFDEVKDFAECGLCGTAAVISPLVFFAWLRAPVTSVSQYSIYSIDSVVSSFALRLIDEPFCVKEYLSVFVLTIADSSLVRVSLLTSCFISSGMKNTVRARALSGVNTVLITCV